MQQYEREEIWFARVVIIFGAKELVDVVLNLFTILKVHSGLAVVAPSVNTDDRTAITYLISSAIVGIYLVAGGRLFSKIAYGRSVPSTSLLTEVGIPDGSG